MNLPRGFLLLWSGCAVLYIIYLGWGGIGVLVVSVSVFFLGVITIEIYVLNKLLEIKRDEKGEKK